MSEKAKNLYEGMYLISASLGDDARNRVFEKIKKGITDRGGEIVKIHDQGRRRLAYEIKSVRDKHREGHYFLLYFNLEPKFISELWQDYKLIEDLLRYITLRTESVMEKIEFKALPELQ